VFILKLSVFQPGR